MKIGIDVTWLKPKKSGGVESFFRNLMDGFLSLNDDNEYVLLVAKDNYESLKNYNSDKRVKLVLCNTNANSVKSHLIWQNIFEYKKFKKELVDICYFPVYEMPLYKCRKIKCVTTIHDVQALHYPEYFSKLENIWFRLGWKKVIKNSEKVVAISDYTKKDLENNFKHKNNIIRIYNPIILNDNINYNFKIMKDKYKIEKDEYFYTLCSLYKHKNLITLINVFDIIVKENIKDIPNILVISGVSGPQKNELINIIKNKKLENNIILTNFVTNEERNCLIKNNNAFLFPSLFEGFGMPPCEALMLGSKVITTRCTSLEEVTKGYAEYIDNPLDVYEWVNKLKNIQNMKKKKHTFKEYDKTLIAKNYLNLFKNIITENK